MCVCMFISTTHGSKTTALLDYSLYGSQIRIPLKSVGCDELCDGASSFFSDANRSSRSPRSSPSSSSSSEVVEIAESVTGAGRLCPFSLEIWVLTFYSLLRWFLWATDSEDRVRFLMKLQNLIQLAHSPVIFCNWTSF